MRQALTVLPAVLLSIGCSSTPEALVVDGQLPGTHWEIVAFEGPLKVVGPAQAVDGGATFHLDAEVFLVEMERRGWGELMPWSWFGGDRASQYYVTWSMDQRAPRNWRTVHFWSKPPGALTDPRFTYRELIADNGDGDNDWTSPNCDGGQAMKARAYLCQRELASDPPGAPGAD